MRPPPKYDLYGLKKWTAGKMINCRDVVLLTTKYHKTKVKLMIQNTPSTETAHQRAACSRSRDRSARICCGLLFNKKTPALRAVRSVQFYFVCGVDCGGPVQTRLTVKLKHLLGLHTLVRETRYHTMYLCNSPEYGGLVVRSPEFIMLSEPRCRISLFMSSWSFVCPYNAPLCFFVFN